MKVAAFQYDPSYLEVEKNLATVEQAISDLDVDLLVLPELFASGYFFNSTAHARSVSEPIPEGRTTQKIERWAETLGCTIVAGLPETDNDVLYNSAVVVDPSGYVGKYRKLHLYYEEKLHFRSGDVGLPVFNLRSRDGIPYVLGVMVCFDWYYPESARSLALAGADVIAHPSNLVRPDCPRAMPIRALENHVFTVTANRTGREFRDGRELAFIGQSLICDPSGTVLVHLDREETGTAVTDIDPSLASQRMVTAHNDLFADRRTDAYRLE